MVTGSAFQEVEAKLLAEDASVLADIAAFRRLGPFFLTRRPTVRLETTYLDTTDFLLVRHGWALRLRRSGAHDWEVSTKGQGRLSGPLHTRSERSIRLPGRPSFPFVPPPTLVEGLPAAARHAALAPILISEVERQRFAVRRGAPRRIPACAELALDSARSRGPNPSPRAADVFYEVEVELEAGTHADVVQLSDLLRAGFHVRPSHHTKLQRGLHHLYGRGVWDTAVDES